MPFLKPLSLNDKLITFNHFIMSVLIGKKAPPAFRAQAVINGSEIVENFSLEDYIGKKICCFFSSIQQILHLFALLSSTRSR